MSLDQILCWADAHQGLTGRWPLNSSGPIRGGGGETWRRVDGALRRGLRGLRRGSSLARLLEQHCGVRCLSRLPKLSVTAILRWADDHHRRTGRWPTANSGAISIAPGEAWAGINNALVHGRRGLPGGESLTRLLIRRRGIHSKRYKPPLTPQLVLRWADAHYRRTGKYPTTASGRVIGVKGESWTAIQACFTTGLRSVPGGDSLPRFLARHGRIEYRTSWIKGRTLTVSRIMQWARTHRRRTGDWPNVASGPVIGAKGEQWKELDRSLRFGYRGLPGGSSLAVLMKRQTCVARRLHRPALEVSQILAWAYAHRARTGAWPTASSGRIIGAASESWAGVNTALSCGFRGLRTSMGLTEFLARELGAPYVKPSRTPLTHAQILAWADAHFRRTGAWPNSNSGPVIGAPNENWKRIVGLMRSGGRGLPPGRTLSELLQKQRGARRRSDLPRLTVSAILRWADAYYRRHGKWPNNKSGPVEAAPGESWSAVDQALTYGIRGLAGGQSLTRLLLEHRGKISSAYKPKLTEKLILRWADAHYRRTGQWPRPTGGPIPESPGDTWKIVAASMYKGFRGMPRGQSLMQLLTEHRGALNMDNKPKLTERMVLLWARAHARRTGQWPTLHSGKVDDAEFENWASINDAMRKGVRGLPGRLTLARFLARRRRPRPLVRRPSRLLVRRRA